MVPQQFSYSVYKEITNRVAGHPITHVTYNQLKGTVHEISNFHSRFLMGLEIIKIKVSCKMVV